MIHSYPRRSPYKAKPRPIRTLKRLWKLTKRYSLKAATLLLIIYLFFTPNDISTIKNRVQSLIVALETASTTIKAWSQEG